MTGLDYIDDAVPAAKEEKKQLTADEKLHIRTLEVEVYRLQAQLQDLNAGFKGAVEALNGAIKQAGEKYGYDLKDYRLDLKTLEFVRANADGTPAQREKK